MAALKSLQPFLRPLGAPRASTRGQFFRFSTATRLRVNEPATRVPSATPTSTSSKSSATTPIIPQDTSSAADQAATEAATDADSAQSPTPKPTLISSRAESSFTSSSGDTHKAPSTPFEATIAADQVVVEAATGVDSAQLPLTRPNLSSKRPKSSKPDKSNKPGKGANPEKPSKVAAQADIGSIVTPKPSRGQPTPIKIELGPPQYHVARSNNDNYPVYTDYKRGGNLHLTTIRKITGDISALRDELRVFLNKRDGEVKINMLTQQVVVKGHHLLQITQFLKARGM